MAYQDLYADADLFFDLNNNYNYLTTAQLKSVNNSIDPDFVADAPPGLGVTHSVKANSGTTSNPYKNFTFENFPVGNDEGRTFTAWLKIKSNVELVSGTSLGGQSLIFYINDPSSSTSDDDRFQFNTGSSYNSTAVGGSDRSLQHFTREVTVSTGAVGRVSGFTNRKLPIDEWVHIAYVLKDNTAADIVEKVIYLNGIATLYSVSANKSAMNLKYMPSDPTIGGLTTFYGMNSNVVNVDVLMSHYALWNRALTKEEIRSQAWYNHENENYKDLVLSDGPTCFFDFDNSDKTLSHSVYGESWEPFDSNLPGIYVNENAFANQKGWRNSIDTSNALNNVSKNTGTTINNRVAELIRSGEYSMEFWFKVSDKPTATKYFIRTDNATALLKNGFIEFRMNSNGGCDINHAYKYTETSYLSGGVTFSNISNVNTGQEVCSLHPGGGNAKNWADNEWHHFVYTHSNTDGSSWSGTAGNFTGVGYIDGIRMGQRNFTNTYGWLDGTDPLTYIDLFQSTTVSTLRDGSVSSLAVYPRRLTEKEIQEHFIAGQDYFSEYGAVKYYDGNGWVTVLPKTWDGTAWVDWVKKYWNGTEWVTI